MTSHLQNDNILVRILATLCYCIKGIFIFQVILDVLGFQKPLEDSIALRRLHHQLYPNHISVESNFPRDIEEDMLRRGHEIQLSNSHAVVQGILVKDEKVYATCDARKGGSPAGI